VSRSTASASPAAGRFWVSIDVDVLASEAMPATPVRQDGGLSLDELAALARPLARHPSCAGLDLLCYDPELDDARHTSGRQLVELLARITRD
jgi:arginase